MLVKPIAIGVASIQHVGESGLGLMACCWSVALGADVGTRSMCQAIFARRMSSIRRSTRSRGGIVVTTTSRPLILAVAELIVGVLRT